MDCRLILNKSNLQHNYLAACKIANAMSCYANVQQKSVVAAVVKANAYGMGAKWVSQSLEEVGCNDFFVATFQEGIDLRKEVKGNVFVLHPIQDLTLAKKHDLIPVCSSLSQIKTCQRLNMMFMLQIETGLSRLGVSCEDAKTIENDPLNKGFITQLIDADNPVCAFQTKYQTKCMSEFSCFKSIANTGGMNHRDGVCSMVRLGRGLYGSCAPNSILFGSLKPVVRIQARVLQLRNVKKGEGIGYQHTFIAPKNMKIAILGMGYADGLPINLNVALGRVGMDLVTFEVDIGDGHEIINGVRAESAIYPLIFKHDKVLVDSKAKEGDWIELISESLDIFAAKCDVNPRLLLVGIGNSPRVERYYE